MNEEISKLRSELQEVTEKFNKGISRLEQMYLLAEAEKRGYKQGTKFKGIVSKEFIYTVQEPLQIRNKDILDDSNWAIYLYDSDQWAEIIPEEKQIEADFIDNIKTFTDKSMFPDEEKKEDHCFKTGDVVKIIENSSYCGLNGVILKISDRFAFVDIDGTFENINFQFKDLIKIKGVDEQSLHDQIREGGWEFIFKNVKLADFTSIQNGYPTNTENFLINKLASYNRLLALEKVLNEGKEGDRLHIVAIEGDELYGVDLSLNNHYPVAFNYSPDRDFAMEFAEKEFKLFYNHK